METIRTLIVDDEPLARDGLRVLLGRHADIEIIGECGSGTRAIEAIRREQPDLVFLDVQMPELGGFEVLERLPAEALPAVIFVTAFDRYALRAFDVHAVDYLLKPFDDERFEQALGHARAQLQQRQAQTLSERLLDLVDDFRSGGAAPEARPAPGSWLRRLSVKSGGRVRFLRTSEIDWIEAADYYVKLHTGEREHLLRESMARLEESLDPRRFMRIHRSAIVNLDRIRELRPDANGESSVVLHDGTRLRLSRGKKEQLTAALSHS